jgi:hypothetical protein
MVDIALIAIACIVPVVLIFANLVIIARYVDPSAAAGHYIAKLMIVRAAGAAAPARRRPP